MKSSAKNSPEKKPVAHQQDEHITDAHKAADEDIEQDPDLSLEPEPGDDLDEGELAWFEGED